MSNKDKIRKLEANLKEATEMLTHMANMITTSTQALKYLAGPDEEEEGKIILLGQIGIPAPKKGSKQPAQEVATECLVILNELQANFRAGQKAKGPDLRVVDEPEEVRLADGGEIVFSTDFDVLYHECCSCQQLHEVSLDWDHVRAGTGDREFDLKLTTRWKQIGAMPLKADITAAGHTVIKREEL